MVDIDVEGRYLVVRVRGFSRIWALRRRIRVPLASIRAVGMAPDAVHGMWKGLRMPGTHLPNLIVAGTYYKQGERRFYDVRRGGPAIELELEGASYDRIIVQVRDAAEAIRRIRAAAPATT
jgi:hypothetical protein